LPWPVPFTMTACLLSKIACLPSPTF